ncbi:MAG: type IV toxin-antitoxin system AbiEi family antitoxin domain-containing protein [Acidimicrobiia bacterium]
MPRDTPVYELASRQGGIVRREQILKLGLSSGLIQRRVTSGSWSRVASGVYRVLRSDSRRDLLRAAITALPTATASHHSAADLHAIKKVPIEEVVVSVHSRTTHLFDGVVVHRCSDLGPVDRTVIDGIPVTTPSRTVVDLASSLGPHHLAAIVDEAVAAQVVRWIDIEEVVARIGRRGKPGIAAMRALLADRVGDRRSTSVLELRANALLDSASLPAYRIEYAIPWDPIRRFDVAFPDHKVAVEWDSRRWHSQADGFQRDRERDRQAAVHGWIVLRFTWSDVRNSPLDVTGVIRQTLELRSP